MRILLIEDDDGIARAVSRNLRGEGYAVDIAKNGIEGEEMGLINQNDVIILDVLLPLQDGWQTCTNLRARKITTPILMLTALDSVENKIKGLDCGADDYLAKPFHTGELLARVRSLARRGSDVKSAVIERFGVRLDTSTHKVTRGSEEIVLSTKEFALLELFMMNAGKILSRETISEHLWDMNFEPRSNVIESFVKFLRQKIDKGHASPLIHTVRGSGYVFSDEAE